MRTSSFPWHCARSVLLLLLLLLLLLMAMVVGCSLYRRRGHPQAG